MKSLVHLIASLLGYASFAAAINNIQFINHCPYDIWFWVVGPLGSGLKGRDEDRIVVPGNHGSVFHGMVNTGTLGGLSLKIRDYPKYRVAPAGIVQLEYYFEPSTSRLWYDLSVINCNHALGSNDPSFCPLVGGGVTLYVPGVDQAKCPPAWCSNGQCINTYERPGNWLDEPSFHCNTGVDVVLETCTKRAGPRTFQDIEPVSIPSQETVPQGPLQISPNGLCGGMTRYTCAGGHWGECCSQWGFCGAKPEYCGPGCQSAFGVCPSWPAPLG